MRQTGLIGAFRLILLVIGFMLFVWISTLSVRNMRNPSALGTDHFAQNFSTEQLMATISNASMAARTYQPTVPDSGGKHPKSTARTSHTVSTKKNGGDVATPQVPSAKSDKVDSHSKPV